MLRRFSGSSANIEPRNISPAFIYAHPTLRQLSSVIHSPDGQGSQVEAKAVEEMAVRHGSGIKLKHPSPSTALPTPLIVLLTGSTGNIGSQVLYKLLQDSNISRVYSLHRNSENATPLKLLADSFESRDLPSKVLQDERLVCVSGDINNHHLGLSDPLYDEVRVPYS